MDVIAAVKRMQSVLGKDEEEKKELGAFLDQYDVFAKDIAGIIQAEGEKLTAQFAEMQERVDRETQGFPVKAFDEAPVVLYGDVTKDDIRRSWRDQLCTNLKHLELLHTGDVPEIQKGLVIWGEDLGDWCCAFFIPVQFRDSLYEVRKLAQLMTRPLRSVHLAKGELAFEDTFDKDLSGWETFLLRAGTVELKDGVLVARDSPVLLWTKGDPHERSVVGFDLTPISRPQRGGVILAFPGLPKPGVDLSVSAKLEAPPGLIPFRHTNGMEPYNWGIETYHTSVFRHGRTHLRHSGNGLKMLNLVMKDPCEETGKTYRVELLQFDETFQVIVDGELIHGYTDAGVYGPVLTKGHFGIKHFGVPGQGMCIQYGNVHIHKLGGKTLDES